MVNRSDLVERLAASATQLSYRDVEIRKPINHRSSHGKLIARVGRRNRYHLHPSSMGSLNPGWRVLNYHASCSFHSHTLRRHKIGFRCRLNLSDVVPSNKCVRDRQVHPLRAGRVLRGQGMGPEDRDSHKDKAG